IDKFRYPWAGRMVDLVVLIRNGWVTFESIQLQKAECNLNWLERDWPLPATPAQSASEVQSKTLPLNEPAIADSAPSPGPGAGDPAETGSEPAARESMPEPELERVKAEHTRWQRDRVIEAIKALLPLDGSRPKGMSIQALTNRINRLPEFQGNQVSDDTVGRALEEIEAAHKK